MDRSWSFSDYSSALSCLQKFKYVCIDKLAPEGGHSADLEFGTALHAAINAILGGDDGEAVFKYHWESVRNKGLEYGRFRWEFLADCGEQMCSRFARLHAKKYVPHTMEKRLYAEYKGIKLEGTMDYLGLYEDKMSLLDFKTTGYAYDKRKPLVGLQLHLYAFLCKESLGVMPEQVGYVPFVKGTMGLQTPLIIPLDEKKMYAMLDDMTDYIKMVQDRGIFPKNTGSCLMGKYACNFFNQCHGGNTDEQV